MQSVTGDTTHIRTFKVGLKTYEITIEAINHTSNVLARNGGIGHIVGEIPHSRSEDGIGEREESSSDECGEVQDIPVSGL